MCELKSVEYCTPEPSPRPRGTQQPSRAQLNALVAVSKKMWESLFLESSSEERMRIGLWAK